MISDIRAGSARWRHEQQAREAAGAYDLLRDSEAVEKPYEIPIPGARDRMSAERMPINSVTRDSCMLAVMPFLLESTMARHQDM